MLLIAVGRAILATVRPLLAEQRWLRGNWLAVNHAGPAVGRIVKSRRVICGMQHIFDVADCNIIFFGCISLDDFV